MLLYKDANEYLFPPSAFSVGIEPQLLALEISYTISKSWLLVINFKSILYSFIAEDSRTSAGTAVHNSSEDKRPTGKILLRNPLKIPTNGK